MAGGGGGKGMRGHGTDVNHASPGSIPSDPVRAPAPAPRVGAVAEADNSCPTTGGLNDEVHSRIVPSMDTLENDVVHRWLDANDDSILLSLNRGNQQGGRNYHQGKKEPDAMGDNPHFMILSRRRTKHHLLHDWEDDVIFSLCHAYYIMSMFLICYNGVVMPNKKKAIKQPKAVLNRRASFDYALGEEIVAGLELTGPEVRAARDGHVQLKGAFVSIRNDELWLNNASFSIKLNNKGQSEARSVDTRARRLLVKRKQIDQLIAARQKSMTIVPTKMLTAGRYIKVVIALGKGKKNYDKRETIKRREQDREARRATKRLA